MSRRKSRKTPQSNFETLSTSGFTLFDDEANERYQQWLLLTGMYCEDGALWAETNFSALHGALGARFGEELVKIHQTDDGGLAVVADPDAPDELFQMASECLSMMENGDHLDETLYLQALEENMTEYWSELSWSDRIELVRDCREDLGLIVEHDCPDALKQYLEERCN